MYIDTSAFVKLYINEPDSEACEAIVSGQPLVSSRLLTCEFQSALHSKESRSVISSQTRAEAWRRFQSDLAEDMVILVPLDARVVDEAGKLMESLSPDISLRTLDALHLATYMGTESGPIFTKDLLMIRAAGRLGLPLAG